MDLNTAWFLLFGILIIGYAILDGFDLGVGILHLFTRDEQRRRINLNAIGPVWDGNEVWLLTGGGALFAAFPVVYATVFSGFYLAFMLLLAALIARAVSLEFRGKLARSSWRRFWDWSFGLGSLVPALLYGVAVGNILRGIPINEQGIFTGSFLGLLNPYSLLVGVTGLAWFIMHGAAFMMMKTGPDHQRDLQPWLYGGWMAFTVLYLVSTFMTVAGSPFLFAGLTGSPLFWILLTLLVAALVYIPVAAKAHRHLQTFLSSSLLMAAATGLTGLSLFPRLVPSSINLEYSLTIYNASSTPKTLTVMLIIALIGMPLVIGYTAFIYRVFRGRVELTEDSY